MSPCPLNAKQVRELTELLSTPPKGEEAFLLNLLTERVPPGVDEAAQVKAEYLAKIVQNKAASPLISAHKAVEILGTMLGGYNVSPLVLALEDKELGAVAAAQLSKTLLVADSFDKIKSLADAGNPHAKNVLQTWADAEWFKSRRSYRSR